MAIDNLNFYNTGLPAGQLTDRYSSQPGCLRSKNLDIFSSSKSVKATAWSNPVAGEGGIIKQDGKLILKTDGKVYDISTGEEVLVVDPSVNFPVYKVSYTGERGTYENAEWGTAQDLVAKYEGDTLKSFVVYSDRASYTWSSTKYVANKDFENIDSKFTQQSSSPYNYGYVFKKTSTSGANGDITLRVDSAMANVPIRIFANQYESSNTDISLSGVTVRRYQYYYDPEIDGMITDSGWQDQTITVSGDIRENGGVLLEIPVCPSYSSWREITLSFHFEKVEGASDYAWSGEFYIDMNGGPNASWKMRGDQGAGDYNEYYSYLPIRERKLSPIGEYYWMKGQTFQPLYTWQGTWAEPNYQKTIRYDFVQYMGWENNVSMDIIGLTVWNEQVYMIGNMDGNGYIIPCDLTGGKGTAYIAYGCTFKGVANIDYLMYLVGEDRGISQLWVYNGQELVAILGGTEEKDSKNLIKNEEQYKFDGKIVNWRKNLILTTEDNRIFQYGQTFGGKGGVFIHELPSEATITGLKTNGNNLEVDYSITVNDTTTNYSTKLQDDKPIRNYNTEWIAEYPIVIGNHLLEKEESDLYASYILPSSNCKLEFWGMANHYHFWTFTSADSYTFSTEASYKMKGCTGNYALKFIEKNDNQYTFRLEGELPIQTTNDMQITDTEGTVLINYSEYNHFRKIGEITTTEYQEGEFRFHNLNNKLELPKSHSLQIMVRGKGTANYTPELFALDLVANQRDRG